jgi:hypothetical protein
MLIATPDEILQKGLEMGGFNHRRQQIAQRKVMAESKEEERKEQDKDSHDHEVNILVPLEHWIWRSFRLLASCSFFAIHTLNFSTEK